MAAGDPRAREARSKAGAPLLDPLDRPAAPAVDAIVHRARSCASGSTTATTSTEGGRAAPDRPLLFAKFANAIIGDGEAIVRPEGTHALDLEVELGVVIGRHGPPRDARGRRWTTSPATSSSTTSAPATGRAARRPSARARRATASGSAPRAATRSCRSGPTSSPPTSSTRATASRLRSWRIPGRARRRASRS